MHEGDHVEVGLSRNRRGGDHSTVVIDQERCATSISEMERETELTQSYHPELADLNDEPGGLLNGIPLLVGGELKTFSLPVPLDDDGTDISLKDWQLGPRTKDPSTTPYSIKPFKGSVRTRFTPIDEDLTSPRGGGQSSPDHFETGPTTPRTPRVSSSASSSEGDQTLDSVADSAAEPPHHPTGGVAFDVALDPGNKSARSLRVSFAPSGSAPAPVVRHRSPLKSRSLHPPKEVKALQPKWESSTKIRHPITPVPPKPHLHAPPHGMRRKSTGSTPRVQAVAPMPAHEIEVVDGSSGYLSEGRGLSLRKSMDHNNNSQSIYYGDHSSNRLSSRDLTMSPVRAFGELPRSFSRKHGAHYQSEDDDDDDDDDEEDTKMGVLCGGGLSDTKLISGDFMRLLSKLCRVPVPSSKQQQQPASMPRGRSKPHLERSKTSTTMSWDAPSTKESRNSVMGRRHSLQLLSEKCSNMPAPTYDALHKPRKIRTHEPHVHFYRTISKTLDQKLKS